MKELLEIPQFRKLLMFPIKLPFKMIGLFIKLWFNIFKWVIILLVVYTIIKYSF